MKKHLAYLKLECQTGVRIRDLLLSKQAALTTAPGPLQCNVICNVFFFNPSAAELFVPILNHFEAGIANAISSFK